MITSLSTQGGRRYGQFGGVGLIASLGVVGTSATVVPPIIVVPPSVASTGGGRSSSEPWRVTWKRRKKFDDAIEATLQEAFAPAGIVDLPREEVRWIKPDVGEFLKKLKGRPFIEEDKEEDLLLLM